MDPDVIERLEEIAPWPDAPPFPEARFVERGERDGLEIVLDLIPRDRPFWILEIGSEFGGSARTFLDVAPGVHVISADMWPENYWLKPVWKDLGAFIRQPNGMLGLFQTYCWPYRDRLFPVRGPSTETLARLHAIGVRPDLIYVDGDHTHDGVFQDLAVAHSLFPDAILVGDDWEYRPTHPRYEGMEVPVQYAVKRFALHRQYDLRVRGTTWVMDTTRKPSFSPPLPRPYEIAARIDKLDKRLEQLSLQMQASNQAEAVVPAAPPAPPLSSRERKLRKLVNDPVGFVQDSKLGRALRGNRD